VTRPKKKRRFPISENRRFFLTDWYYASGFFGLHTTEATWGLLNWCGDRRTVVGREGPVFAGLEFGGFFDVPHRVSINKSAGYGFPWNQIGNF
jgi:hypothetical protein